LAKVEPTKRSVRRLLVGGLQPLALKQVGGVH
jgi:hypothetical protein